KIREGLKEIIAGGGNNTLHCADLQSGIEILQKKNVGIVLVSIDQIGKDLGKLDQIRQSTKDNNCYILIISKLSQAAPNLVKGINRGAVDFIQHPFNPNLVRSKVEVYKSMYYKDQRIGQLLENIFPSTVLGELSSTGKYSPKRVQNGVVLFTDFVDF